VNCRIVGPVFETNVDKAMSSTTSKRPIMGRLLTVCFTSALFFFGMTGFNALPERHATPYEDPSAAAFAREFNSVMSHNLIVDTDELRCLALNIYWEARSEPLDGQLAVAAVTMNRVASKKFPNTICKVVKQGGAYRRHRCQFSWQCDGESDKPEELQAWRSAQQLARLFLAGIYDDPTQEAKWYHADYVKPDWATRMTQTAKIGRHIFYTEQMTQTASLR
jgi:spore germination cell wall hydrolase CwlJ-like protein